MPPAVRVRVPASTANLGPAFDCLGLSLDLWNETSFELVGDEIVIDLDGEGANELARDRSNLIVRAFGRLYQEAGQPAPRGLKLTSSHAIPPSGGLGSSAAATTAGLMGANALLGDKFSINDLLQIGADMEGHADNLGAALYGGLILVTSHEGRFQLQKLECPLWNAVAVVPELALSTKQARQALPAQLAFADAVFNIGRSLRVVEALRTGDTDGLVTAMEDRLHQPHRLPLIPGASEAVAAAQKAGAAAAISGAGPGVIAFVEDGRQKAIAEALRAPFGERGISTKLYLLSSTPLGAQVI